VIVVRLGGIPRSISMMAIFGRLGAAITPAIVISGIFGATTMAAIIISRTRVGEETTALRMMRNSIGIMAATIISRT